MPWKLHPWLRGPAGWIAPEGGPTGLWDATSLEEPQEVQEALLGKKGGGPWVVPGLLDHCWAF